VLGPVGW